MISWLIKRLFGTLVGIGVIYACMRYLSIALPIPHTFGSLASGVLALLSLWLGPLLTAVVAFTSHAAYDGVMYTIGWWTWVACDAIFGFVLALVMHRVVDFGTTLTWERFWRFQCWQFWAAELVWFLLAPAGDILIYKANPLTVFAQGAMIAMANAFSVGVVITLIWWGCNRWRSAK